MASWSRESLHRHRYCYFNRLVLSDVPIEYQVAEPSGYYAPPAFQEVPLSAQDSYWSIYNESVIFNVSGNFSANITNNSGSSSGSGSSYTYTKTGTNSATLSYTIDGAGHSFEYDLQFWRKTPGSTRSTRIMVVVQTILRLAPLA